MNDEASTNRSSGLAWSKSSYSGTSGGDCVEVALTPRTVHVRDSKRAQGPILHVSPQQWDAFVSYATAGQVAVART
jgi:hypothetical protein